MRKTAMAALAAASLLALAGCKQAGTGGNEAASGNAAAPAGAGSIDGTWKTDLSTMTVESKPDEYLLKAGQFSCSTCTPPYSIAADGAMHPVTGRPYADQLAMKVDDDHNLTRTAQKGGKTTSTVKYSVSADGNTLTISFDDETGTKPVKGSYTETRVAPAPAGTHAISGSWKQSKPPSSVSDEGLTATFKLDGNVLHMTAPTGQSYDATIGGPDVPIKGDIGGTTAAVTRNGDSFVETDKRNGKVVSITTMTPGSDGKLHVVNEDKLGGSTAKFDMNKQS